jgi:hypothetical protein
MLFGGDLVVERRHAAAAGNSSHSFTDLQAALSELAGAVALEPSPLPAAVFPSLPHAINATITSARRM